MSPRVKPSHVSLALDHLPQETLHQIDRMIHRAWFPTTFFKQI